MAAYHPDWPELPLAAWQDTCTSLHLWSQIVGKVRLAYTPWLNHSWHIPFHVTTRGLTTSLIPCGERGLEIDFNLLDHRLEILTSAGETHTFALRPMSVAAFYEKVLAGLGALDIEPHILPRPVEIPDPVLRFPDDTAPRPYDARAADRFRQVLVQVHRVFSRFRAGFIGKASPVHFFWGAFDLAVTRFSGRPAPRHPGGVPNCADWVMEEAYSHEVSSAGFWPGTGLGEPAFYAYAYPEPPGFRDAAALPHAAYYHDGMGEFILPYEAARGAADPDALLLEFLQATYVAAADAGNWDRASLEAGRDRPAPA